MVNAEVDTYTFLTASRAGRSGKAAKIADMATVHMTSGEVTRNFRAVLQKIGEGVEVVVEQDHRPVALIRSPMPQGRLLSECIALAETRGTTAIPDEGFMKDVAEGIAGRNNPWIPPSWE